MEHCPPHFESLIFDLRARPKDITDWVYENLAGRFYFDDHYHQTETGSVALSKMIAFEDASELSYFGLFLDTLNSPSVY